MSKTVLKEMRGLRQLGMMNTQKLEFEQKLKDCECGAVITNLNATFIGVMESSKHDIILFNCPQCHSTKCEILKEEE